MFYINSRKKYGTISESEALYVLQIPAGQRSAIQHQIVYCFFKENDTFKEIQKNKSLHARLKCVAAVKLVANKHYDSRAHIVLHRFDNTEIAVLSRQYKKKTMQANESQIKENMNELSQFPMFSMLRYDQLLYFAKAMQRVSYSYQELVYRQQEQPQYIYLIVEGSFHYLKSEEQLHKSRINRANMTNIKYQGNQSKEEVVLLAEEEESPNRSIRKSRMKKMNKVGLVEGGMGQVIGVEQLVLGTKKIIRTFSVVCSSTCNKVIRIAKVHFLTILDSNPQYKALLTKQMLQKNRAKQEIILQGTETRLKLAKHNNPSVTLPVIKDKQRHQSHKNDFIPRLHAFANEVPYNCKVFSSYLQNRNMEQRQKPSQSLQILLEQSDNKDRTILKVMASPSRPQDNRQFSLETKRKYNSLDQTVPSESKQHVFSRPSQQTHVVKEKGICDQNKSKSSLPNIANSETQLIEAFMNPRNSRKKRQQVFIDANELVREKKEIMSRKVTGRTRQHLFPVEKLSNKKQKEAAKQTSPVHSKQFMEKMLLGVLRKVGYADNSPEATPQSQQTRSVPHKKFSQSQKRQQENESVLSASVFDECYFHKLG